MKKIIQIVSDLHLEFRRDLDEYKSLVKQITAPGTEGATLIIAGDLMPMTKPYMDMAKWTFMHFANHYERVLYVAGNHEYYTHPVLRNAERQGSIKKNIKRVVADVNQIVGKKNVHYLNNDAVSLDGIIVFGGTMWGDFIQDQYYVPELRNFSVDENERFRKILTTVDVDLVISHHLPSMQCVDVNYKDSSINSYFVCDMTTYLDQGVLLTVRRPALWACGHTHIPFSKKVGKTTIVANPAGYPKEYKNLYKFAYRAIYSFDTVKKTIEKLDEEDLVTTK
jgi:predicted phosphodiesterase